MALDIFGPANAPGSVTIRPGETRSFGASDTFFKDCTSPSVDDGTEFQAGWFNQVLATLRSLARGNGLTGASAQIVIEDNADDGIILKSVKHLMQRGQASYAVASGTANDLAITLSPAAAEYKEGMVIVVKITANNTGNTTANINGLGVKSVVRGDLTELPPSALQIGNIVALVYDGTHLQLAWSSRPTKRSGPLTFYVNDATGNDTTNTGLTVGSPFKTIQKAITIAGELNLNNNPVTIFVADGAYTGPISIGQIDGFGSLTLTGNTATPANVTVTANNSTAFHVFAGSGIPVKIEGFKVITTGASGADPAHGVWAHSSSIVTLSNMNYGASVNSHVGVDDLAFVLIAGTQTISGNAASAHLFSVHAGSRINSSPTSPPSLTISAAVTLGYFAYAAVSGNVEVTYSSITNPGNVTGTRYLSTVNGTVITGGGGPNYYPGTIAGSTSNGGVYV